MSVEGPCETGFFESDADQVLGHRAENAEADLPVGAPCFDPAKTFGRGRPVQLDLDLVRPVPGHRHMPRILALTSTFGPPEGIRCASATAMGQAVRSN